MTIASGVALLLAIGAAQVIPTSAQAQPSGRQAGGNAGTSAASRATLIGTVHDPLGLPVEGLPVSIESGALVPAYRTKR